MALDLADVAGVPKSGEGSRHFAEVSADSASIGDRSIVGSVRVDEWHHDWTERLGRRLARRQDNDALQSQQRDAQQAGDDPGLDKDPVGQGLFAVAPT